jgi:Thiamine pyrophosphate enzyme, central domain
VTPPATVGGLLRRVLGAAGVDAVYGRPVPGVPVVPAPPAEAALLAEAHGIVHGRPAAVVAGDPPVVRVSGVDGEPVAVGDGPELAALAAALGDGLPAVRLDADPGAPAPVVTVPRPPAVDRWVPVDDAVVAAVAAARRPVVLAGPGVVRAGAVPGLHAVAAAAHVGVLNTFGAKGVFDWRSRHHLATAGLQARDWELGGLADADVIVATGMDGSDTADHSWRDLAPVVEVAPGALAPLAERWSRPPQDIPVPPLRAALAAITQDGWRSDAAPLAPTRVTLEYGRTFGAGGLVAAAAGRAGYWVARTFATTELGTVVVVGSPALAAACAAVARLRRPARPVLTAVDDEPAGLAGVAAVQAAAHALGVAVPAHVWSDEALPVDASVLTRALADAADADEPWTGRLATDPAQLARMVDAAGHVTAWAGFGG